MSSQVSRSKGPGKPGNEVRVVEVEYDASHRRLQRIVRQPGPSRPVPANGRAANTRNPPPAKQKAATLAPELVNPASVSRDEEVQFQCTECDMIVKGSDPYCPFCGAIFADGPLAQEEEAEEAAEKPQVERPEPAVEFVRPEKFDLFSLVKSRSRSRELLYQEALNGFAGSARLLEEIEHLISEVSSLGRDTTKARRLVGSAWEACREGDWSLVSALARQTEEIMSPSVPDLVRCELAKAREILTDAKASGMDISKYVLRFKNAMHALQSEDPDEALRITKELMDTLREDSVSWNKGRSTASRNSF